jgi:hypothetical protein
MAYSTPRCLLTVHHCKLCCARATHATMMPDVKASCFSSDILPRPEALLALAVLHDALKTRHGLLDVLAHLLQHFDGRAMLVRRSFANVTQPNMRHLFREVFLGHALHWLKLFPVRLPLDVVLVHHARAIDDDLEPSCSCLW